MNGYHRFRGGIYSVFCNVIQGAVANDKTNRTLTLFVEGIYTVKEALKKLRFNKLNDQISIHTDKALSCLTIINKNEYGN